MGALQVELDGPNPAFGRAVQAVLSERGLTMRGQKRRTGIDHVTMGDWCHGSPPRRMERLLDFCRAFNLDANEWLERAGLQARFPDRPSLPDTRYESDDEATREGYLDARGISPVSRKLVADLIRQLERAERRGGDG